MTYGVRHDAGFTGKEFRREIVRLKTMVAEPALNKAILELSMAIENCTLPEADFPSLTSQCPSGLRRLGWTQGT